MICNICEHLVDHYYICDCGYICLTCLLSLDDILTCKCRITINVCDFIITNNNLMNMILEKYIEKYFEEYYYSTVYGSENAHDMVLYYYNEITNKVSWINGLDDIN